MMVAMASRERRQSLSARLALQLLCLTMLCSMASPRAEGLIPDRRSVSCGKISGSSFLRAPLRFSFLHSPRCRQHEELLLRGSVAGVEGKRGRRKDFGSWRAACSSWQHSTRYHNGEAQLRMRGGAAGERSSGLGRAFGIGGDGGFSWQHSGGYYQRAGSEQNPLGSKSIVEKIMILMDQGLKDDEILGHKALRGWTIATIEYIATVRKAWVEERDGEGKKERTREDFFRDMNEKSSREVQEELSGFSPEHIAKVREMRCREEEAKSWHHQEDADSHGASGGLTQDQVQGYVEQLHRAFDAQQYNDKQSNRASRSEAGDVPGQMPQEEISFDAAGGIVKKRTSTSDQAEERNWYGQASRFASREDEDKMSHDLGIASSARKHPNHGDPSHGSSARLTPQSPGYSPPADSHGRHARFSIRSPDQSPPPSSQSAKGTFIPLDPPPYPQGSAAGFTQRSPDHSPSAESSVTKQGGGTLPTQERRTFRPMTPEGASSMPSEGGRRLRQSIPNRGSQEPTKEESEIGPMTPDEDSFGPYGGDRALIHSPSAEEEQEPSSERVHIQRRRFFGSAPTKKAPPIPEGGVQIMRPVTPEEGEGEVGFVAERVGKKEDGFDDFLGEGEGDLPEYLLPKEERERREAALRKKPTPPPDLDEEGLFKLRSPTPESEKVVCIIFM